MKPPSESMRPATARPMTLLAELYANGFGVPAKRCKGSRMVQARGRSRRRRRDVCPRLVPRQRPRRTKRSKAKRSDCSRQPPSSETRRPPTTLVFSISKAGNSPRILPALLNCFAPPLRPAVPKPCTRLRSFTRKASGLPKDAAQATRLLGMAALADNVDAQVEYGIALFNGTGVTRRTKRPQPRFCAVRLLKAARLRKIGWRKSSLPDVG